MAPLAQALIVTGFACFMAGFGALIAAWPRLQALERRGLTRGPVPDLWASQWGISVLRLMWLTPIPRDRVTLRRLLFIARAGQVFGLVVMLMAVLVPPTSQAPEVVMEGPPPVTLQIE